MILLSTRKKNIQIRLEPRGLSSGRFKYAVLVAKGPSS